MAKTISPAVPAVAPLTGIEDDAARQALQALADAHTTRNSAGDEGFVTRGELTQAVPQMIVEGLSATGGSVAGAGSGANWWGAVQAEIDRAVFASLAYQQINKKIEWMDATNNLSLKKIAELGDGFTTERIERREGDTALLTEVKALKVTTANNTAAILEEQTVRTTADSALAQDLLTLTSQVNTNSATIQTNQETQATWNTAAASQITTLQVGVADNAAAIQAESTARATLEGDLQATWTVRANVNGHVAGVALGVEGSGGTATSAFVVQADKFAVVTPGRAPKVPFYIGPTNQITLQGWLDWTYVDGRPTSLSGLNPSEGSKLSGIQSGATVGATIGTNLTKSGGGTAAASDFIASWNKLSSSNIATFMTTAAIGEAYIANAAIVSAKIADAAITTAKIGSAQVDTLQIKGNAVTVPQFTSRNAEIYPSSGAVELPANTHLEYVVAEDWINTGGSPVILIFSGTGGIGIVLDGYGGQIGGYRGFSVYVNGVRTFDQHYTAYASNKGSDEPVEFKDLAVKLDIPAGSVHIKLAVYMRSNYSEWYVLSRSRCTMTLLGCKR